MPRPPCYAPLGVAHRIAGPFTERRNSGQTSVRYPFNMENTAQIGKPK